MPKKVRRNRIVTGGFLEKASNRKKLGFFDFPFESKLSFVPLINHWKSKLTSHHIGEALLAKEIIRRLDDCLDFLAPIKDVKLLEAHWEFVELMAAGLMPLAFEQHLIVMLVKPFEINGFYQSPGLQKIIKAQGTAFYVNKDPEVVRNTMVIRACIMILNRFYGQKLWMDLPIIFIARKGESERHFKAYLNIDFAEIKKLRPLKALSQQQINKLLGKLDDLGLWLEHIPPSHFEFHGLVKIQLQEVTEEEVLSNIKKKLLERDAVVATENIKDLERQLKYYFRMPGLRLGLCAVDYPPDKHSINRYKIRHHLLAGQYDHLLDRQFEGSVYHEACEAGNMIIVEELLARRPIGPLEQALLNDGLQSLAVVPLTNVRGSVIGVLELAASEAYQLNSFSSLLIAEIRSLFRTALARRRQEIDNEIDTIIRDHYTTLHPSVEWKFLENAMDLLERFKEGDGKAIAEPIVFKNVYALYGQGDIVNSTVTRNQVIQADLLQNLKQILALFDHIPPAQFPLLQHYKSRVNKEIEQLSRQMTSNGELRILDYLKQHLHPFLNQLKEQQPDLQRVIDTYFVRLDPELQIIYEQRKAYEDSLALINEQISKLLKRAQKKAQQLLPHYFEQYITDGVQFDIYIGQSLLQDAQFNALQLRNIRLWQLVVMCEITRKIHELRPSLPMPLTTAQMILVHSIPLSIRFRMDEKRFDVDGAYNIRYAILKKRVDKARVVQTGERLTQPGRVAIVYQQENEREEYLEYIEFLRSEHYLEGDLEDVSLKPMQGVEGLRALRFKVDVKARPLNAGGDNWLNFE